MKHIKNIALDMLKKPPKNLRNNYDEFHVQQNLLSSLIYVR